MVIDGAVSRTNLPVELSMDRHLVGGGPILLAICSSPPRRGHRRHRSLESVTRNVSLRTTRMPSVRVVVSVIDDASVPAEAVVAMVEQPSLVPVIYAH